MDCFPNLLLQLVPTTLPRLWLAQVTRQATKFLLRNFHSFRNSQELIACSSSSDMRSEPFCWLRSLMPWQPFQEWKESRGHAVRASLFFCSVRPRMRHIEIVPLQLLSHSIIPFIPIWHSMQRAYSTEQSSLLFFTFVYVITKPTRWVMDGY